MRASAAFTSVSFVVSGVPACVKGAGVEFVCSQGPSERFITWVQGVLRLPFLTGLAAESQPGTKAGLFDTVSLSFGQDGCWPIRPLRGLWIIFPQMFSYSRAPSMLGFPLGWFEFSIPNLPHSI